MTKAAFEKSVGLEGLGLGEVCLLIYGDVDHLQIQIIPIHMSIKNGGKMRTKNQH